MSVFFRHSFALCEFSHQAILLNTELHRINRLTLKRHFIFDVIRIAYMHLQTLLLTWSGSSL